MGARLTRYRKDRVLGEGGGGRVWLVEDLLFPGRQLALKELVGTAPSKEASLRREFATLRTLRHPNLAEVFDFEVSAGVARFALEFIDGVDLVTAVGREGHGSLVRFAAEALRALTFLHDFDLLHRDLKPSNLLVRHQPHRDCRVVLLDFGLAIHGKERTGSSVAGTIDYMAPELLEGAPPSRRSDLYGLGAVLRESVKGGVGRELSEWIGDLAARDPDDRPASARDALVRLAQLFPDDVEIETVVTRSARLASGEPAGRERECDSVWRLMSDATGPRVILLGGDVGTGKSRLLRWLGSRAVAAGWDVGVEVAHDLERRDASLTTLLARWREKAAAGPTVVFLDELEQATETIVDFVDEVARTPAAAPLCVVAAFRTAEIDNETLRRLIEDASLPIVQRVELLGLGREGTAAMVLRATGTVASDPQIDWLLGTSGGNPLLLESLLTEGAWESGRVATLHPTLEQSVQTRVEGLTEDTRRWVLALVVLGARADSQLLPALADLTAQEAERCAAVAAAAGLATSDGQGWSPASRVVTAVIRASSDPDVWSTLNRRAAELAGDDADPALLARLCSEAGEPGRAVEAALRVAKASEQAGQPAEAARWHRFALCHLARVDERRAGLREAQARCLESAQRNAKAIRALGFVLRKASTEKARTLAMARRAFLLAIDGRATQALRISEKALEAARTINDPMAIAESTRARAASLSRLQRPIEGLSAALDAADRFSAERDTAKQASSLYYAGILASNVGRFEEASTHLERVAQLAAEIGDHRLLANTWISLAIAAARQGKLDESLGFAARGEVVARERDLPAQLYYVAMCRTTPLIQLGRFDRGLESAREAESLAAHRGIRIGLVTARLQHADILTNIGRSGQSIEVLDRALREPGEVEPKFIRYLKVTLAEALIEQPHPDHERIRTLLAEVIEDPLLDRKGLFGALVVELERRVLAQEPAGEIRERYEAEVASDRALLEPAWELRARLAEAQELYAAGDFERAIAVASAAAGIASDKELPALEARLHAVVSDSHRSAGRTGPAREALDRAREALDRAASRIDDEQMRADFLGRPVFRPIRRSPLGRATAAEGRLLAIYEMVRTLNSETDPEALLESMLDMAIAVVRAERGLILLEEGKGDYAVRASRNVEPDAAEDAVGFSRSVVLEAATGAPVLAIDTGDDPRLRDLKSVSLYHIRSVLCVPLRSRGRRIGAVYLDNRSGGATFTRDDLGFLEAFADHAALALENATIRRELELENRRLRAATESRTRLGALVGRSPAMHRVYDRIEKFAATTLPVLVLGESGTGKELAARAIHDLGPRRAAPFLVENCAAVADTLLESELFGHVRGAFTGAERDRVGLFEQADCGTLFLDEIGDTSPAMQARLLRVLQEGEVRRVGDETRRRVDVRVLAATNKDLDREVAEGRFRDDLRHRLQVLVLELPPLRERPGDIAPLVDELLDRIGREHGTGTPKIRADVVDRLERCPWPGNVRQLENCLKRLTVLAADGPITLDVVRSDDGLERLLLGDAPSAPALRLDRNEKEQIRRALDEAGGNRARAAKLLGISRATIFRKLKEHGLS